MAHRLRRDATLIELNPEYAAMARKRIGQERGIQAAKKWLQERGARPYAPPERTWTWRQMMEAWLDDD